MLTWERNELRLCVVENERITWISGREAISEKFNLGKSLRNGFNYD